MVFVKQIFTITLKVNIKQKILNTKNKKNFFDVFKKAFNGITFIVKPKVDDVNAEITMEALDMNVDNPLPETVQICGSVLLPVFDSFRKIKLPSVDEVRHKVVECLQEYVDYIYQR